MKLLTHTDHRGHHIKIVAGGRVWQEVATHSSRYYVLLCSLMESRAEEIEAAALRDDWQEMGSPLDLILREVYEQAAIAEASAD